MVLGAAFLCAVALADPSSDFAALLDKARSGDPPAETAVGIAYCQGTGVTKDYQQAFVWLQKAAGDDEAKAKSVLGWLYATGSGVPRDDARALQWYLAGAQGGDAFGQLQVAEAYRWGKGVAKDDAQAAAWYTKAAIQGEVTAQNRLGLAYLNGVGVQKNPGQAYNYFLHAAYSGYGPAQFNVALCYWQGVFVAPDPLQAYKWCQLAVQNDHDNAADVLLRTLMIKLTGAQLSEGDRLVDNWPKERSGNPQLEPLQATMTDGQRARMPFVWISKHLIISVSVGGYKDLKFMVDTGAPSSLVDDATAVTLGLPAGTEYVPAGGTGKDLVLARRVDHLALGLRDLDLTDITLLRCDLSSMSAVFGVHIDGVLGYDILKSFVVRLAYNDRTLDLINPAAFNPRNAGSPIPITVRTAHILLPATICHSGVTATSSLFIMDTGSDSSITLSKSFITANPGLELIGGVPSGSSGLGGTSRESILRCDEIMLGDMALIDPIVDLVAQNQGIWTQGLAGLIGNEIWRRFDVTIDFPDSKLFLKKNYHFNDPYRYVDIGLAVNAVGPDLRTYVVAEVVPGSPAAAAGFQAGDILLQVDHAALHDRSMDQVRLLFRHLGRHHIVINRGGHAYTLTIELSAPL